MKTCPLCGAQNRDTARFCSSCANPFTATGPTQLSGTQSDSASSAGPAAELEEAGAARQPTESQISSTVPTRDSTHDPGETLQQPAVPIGTVVDASVERETREIGIMDHGSAEEAMQTSTRSEPQENAASDKTAALARPQTDFASLPEGALLHDRRYEVLEILQEGQESNVYSVRSHRAVRPCPNPDCGYSGAEPDESHCPECGIDLSEVEPVCRTYLMREAADPTRFDVVAQMLHLGLSHPGLLLPEEHFLETPYADSSRAYLVTPEDSRSLAASLPVPQALPQVLDWGLQLADAMVYLHEHRFAIRGVGLNEIAMQDGRRAYWTNLTEVELVSLETQSVIHQRFAEDVRMLAHALFYLSTGHKEYTPAVTLPDQVKGFFARALTSRTRPFQSAYEFSLALKDILSRMRRPASITLVFGCRTDTGRERHLNEDGLLTLVLEQAQESVNRPLGLFVVADGMGGHEAGEVATRLTLETIRRKAIAELLAPGIDGPVLDLKSAAGWSNSEETKQAQWLRAVTKEVNTTVFEQRRRAGTNMGNTLVMALVHSDTAHLGNVGDSRAYLINAQGIRQITTDHSLVERLVATGRISREESRTHPDRGVIYRTIGDQRHVDVDLFEERLEVGDFLLLCSDGLNGMITDEDIFNIVRSSVSPQEACDRLADAANAAGGEDNVTVIVVQVST